MSIQDNTGTDHGRVTPSRRFHVSWVWLFPLMAASAAGYMFFHNWLSQGPVIRIDFRTAPGIRTGKTQLIYRGVVAGDVCGVELDPTLEKVRVDVRLKKFAEGIARGGTKFWIDKPVISLSGASGIESLIEGNSIQAMMGTGAPTYAFTGSEIAPIEPAGSGHESFRLRGAIMPFLDRGSPIYFRGIAVGVVRAKDLDEGNIPYVDILIDTPHASLIRSNARFWVLQPSTIKMGPGVFKLDIAGLKTFLYGGICFDYFGEEGEAVAPGAEFELCANHSQASANSPPITLEFKDGQGLLAGETQLRYMGVPVGLVEKVVPMEGKAVVTARFQSGYDMLRRKGSVFSVMRPSLSLQKVTGLETLVSGIYIDCIPGPKGPAGDRFSGTTQEQADLIEQGDSGFKVLLRSPSTKISAGAQVSYRGITVGRIVGKSLSPDGHSVTLTLSIEKRYAPLLHENTRFWDASGLKISGGLINLSVRSAPLESKLGGVDFGTPEGEAMGAPVNQGHVFTLYDSPKKDWLQWLPNIPLAK